MYKQYFFASLILTAVLLCGPMLNAGKTNNCSQSNKTVVERCKTKRVFENDIASKKSTVAPLLPGVLL